MKKYKKAYVILLIVVELDCRTETPRRTIGKRTPEKVEPQAIKEPENSKSRR
jgi:hypothetical protein